MKIKIFTYYQFIALVLWVIGAIYAIVTNDILPMWIAWALVLISYIIRFW